MTVTRFCSKWFRDELLKLYPNLDGNPQRWLFLQYLIYAQHFDIRTDQLVVSAELLSEWLDKGKSFFGNNFSVRDIATDFSTNVFPVELSEFAFEPSKRNFKSRILLSSFPQEVEQLWRVERCSRLTPRVDFATGNKAVSPQPAVPAGSESASEASKTMVE